ncbi:MAG: LecA/PA-IL family lectin [Pyrinomonadaceae bacterium]
MIFRKLSSRCLSLVIVVALCSILAFADTIRLKDGSIIKGRITGYNGGRFTITVGEGARKKEFTFYADEIESIVFDRPEPLVRRTEPVASNAGNYDPPAEKKPPVVVVEESLPPAQTKPKIDPTVDTSSSRPLIKPVVLNVNVLADNTSNGWTNSGWVVKRGQRIRIVGDGEVSLGKGQKTGPSGQYTLSDDKKLLKSVPTGALIAVIGDDNNDFIYIGNDREFVATRDGTLFLGLNEGNLDDNSGSFKVRIEITPES